MNLQNGNMRIVVDIDGVIAIIKGKDYENAIPIKNNIEYFNQLYDAGHTIIYFTGRGYESKIDYNEMTRKQFDKWGVKYHDLVFGKPGADVYIDDKAVNISQIQPFINGRIK